MTYIPRRAIVTGPAGGPGHATAVTLAHAGFDIGIAWDADERGAERAAREVRDLGRRAATKHIGARDGSDLPRVLRHLASELGGLDVFVTADQSGLSGSRARMADEVRVAAREMARAHHEGRIIVIDMADEPAETDGPSLHDDIAALAMDVVGHGITVNLISPASTGGKDSDSDVGAAWTLRHPKCAEPFPGQERDIAAVVEFLASPVAACITGQSFVVGRGTMRVRAEDGTAVVAAGSVDLDADLAAPASSASEASAVIPAQSSRLAERLVAGAVG